MGDAVSVKRWLSEAELDHQLKAADNGKRARRLGFIKNLYRGDSVTEAIVREGRSESTGYRWLHRWNDGGLDALLPDYGGGRPPKLSESEQEAFLERIASHSRSRQRQSSRSCKPSLTSSTRLHICPGNSKKWDSRIGRQPAKA